ncbi:hypothetical protein D3C76_1548580 [compost metagenome]
MFGGDEHQLAVHFDAGAHGITMAGLDLGWIITEVERQRDLAFDRAALLIEHHRRGVGQGNVLQAHAQGRVGRQGDALQVEDFAIEARDGGGGWRC